MSFAPVIPVGGLAGWSFFKRTMPAQRDAFEKSTDIQREADYFRKTIGKIRTAEDLVADRRLLSVALGAFGLGDDINNRFFIRKVLSDGTLDTEALGQKLADKRYLALAKAFGFGDFAVPNTQLSDFPDKIIRRYLDIGFEEAAGAQNEDMRLAMALERELDTIIDSATTRDGAWFQVMGNPPVRRVFEAALGLPSGFGALPIDQQLTAFRDKTQRRFGAGEVADFADPALREKLLNNFLVRSEISAQGAGFSPAAAALSLLRGGA